MAGHCGLILLLWSVISLASASVPQYFLNTNDIRQTPLNGLPAKIDVEFPPNCENLTVDYTCQEQEKPDEPKTLSELEPFTKYSCTGQVKNKNVTIDNTTAVSVYIDCDPKITHLEKSATDTSIDLRWETKSVNCLNLTQLEKFSYECSCWPSHSKSTPIVKKLRGGSCRAAGLNPYTTYTCTVQPTYNNQPVDTSSTVTQRTDIGKPAIPEGLALNSTENNGINVTCKPVTLFNGPDRGYIARLYISDTGDELVEKKKNTKCDFHFKDLNYSMIYEVQVTSYNGKMESEVNSISVETSYNDKPVIVFLVFVIIVIILAVAVYTIYVWKNRESANRVREDAMVEAVYVNVRPPK